MRRFPTVVPVLSLALAAGALTLAACSDSITNPTRPSITSPDLSVVAGPGANQLTIASDAGTQLCPSGQVNGDYTVPASYAPILAGCVAAPSLMPALAVYNPGWDAPITGSSWIGPTANSSDYRTTPGRFVFQETFTLPAGVTNPTLSLTSMADNVVAVYLNGHLIGSQTVQDCNAAPCNWSVAGQLTTTTSNAAFFNIGGTNILTILLIDTPIGFPLLTGPLGGPAPNYGCFRPVQPAGSAGFPPLPQTVPTSPNHVVANRQSAISNLGAANQSGCENPTGVDYKGLVSWTVPAPPEGCSPGYYKKHDMPGGNLTFAQAGFTNTGTSSGVTLKNALDFKGGPDLQDAKNILLRQAAAAYANSKRLAGFPLTTAQVIAQTNAALASNDRDTILAFAAVLDADNNLEGPNC